MTKPTLLFIATFTFIDFAYGQKTIISGSIKNMTANSIKCNFIPNSVLEKPTAITIPVTEGKFIQELSITKKGEISISIHRIIQTNLEKK